MVAAQTKVSVETNKEVQNDPTLKTKVRTQTIPNFVTIYLTRFEYVTLILVMRLANKEINS